MKIKILNTLGLMLGIAGVIIIFIYGPPQPNLNPVTFLSIGSNTVLQSGERVGDREAKIVELREKHDRYSKLGLGLIALGFIAQIGATWLSGKKKQGSPVINSSLDSYLYYSIKQNWKSLSAGFLFLVLIFILLNYLKISIDAQIIFSGMVAIATVAYMILTGMLFMESRRQYHETVRLKNLEYISFLKGIRGEMNFHDAITNNILRELDDLIRFIEKSKTISFTKIKSKFSTGFLEFARTKFFEYPTADSEILQFLNMYIAGVEKKNLELDFEYWAKIVIEKYPTKAVDNILANMKSVRTRIAELTEVRKLFIASLNSGIDLQENLAGIKRDNE